MNDPFFSIVIPTYNRAGVIGATIASVLGQSYANFEIIVVDDGSTDNTQDVVESIVDPRLKYHKKENEERAAARNAGRAMSKGDYVTFFDSDDLLLENHLRCAAEVIAKHSEPEVFHLGYEIRNLVTCEISRMTPLPVVANDRLIEGNRLSCNGVFVRKDIAELHPFNTERGLSGTEDYELWLRLASRYPIICDKRVTSVIIQHDERSVVNTNRTKLERRIEFLESSVFADDAFNARFGARVGEFKANNRLYIAVHLALMGERREAFRYLANALGCSPKALLNRALYGTLRLLIV